MQWLSSLSKMLTLAQPHRAELEAKIESVLLHGATKLTFWKPLEKSRTIDFHPKDHPALYWRGKVSVEGHDPRHLISQIQRCFLRVLYERVCERACINKTCQWELLVASVCMELLSSACPQETRLGNEGVQWRRWIQVVSPMCKSRSPAEHITEPNYRWDRPCGMLWEMINQQKVYTGKSQHGGGAHTQDHCAWVTPAPVGTANTAHTSRDTR